MKKKPRAMIGKVPVWCAHDKIVNCVELKPNPKNPNTHPASQIVLLGKIITEQGWRGPITVSKRSGLIVKGHARLEAAFKAGILKAPVDLQDYESEAAEHADMVADNRLSELAEIDDDKLSKLLAELSDFDIDMDLTGFFDDELKELLGGQKGLTDDDEVPEVPDDPVTKIGDLYTLGDHRLLCGDATSKVDVDRLMDGQKADIVFTDPPYGISIVNKGKLGASAAKLGFVGAKGAAKARKYKPVIGDDEPFDPVFLLSMSDKVILWGANNYASRLPDKSLWLVWDKKDRGGLDHNNFSDCELAWTNLKGKAIRIYRFLWAGLLRKGGRKEELKERVHTTQKTVGLLADIIKDYSDKNDIVLDLFGGSGSTLIACEKTNRKCYMMEIDPHYCDVIVKRWENYTGSKARLT